MKRSAYLAVAVLVGLTGVRCATAQSFLDKLGGSRKDGMSSVLAKPQAANSGTSGVYLGLIGDDVGEGGQGVHVLSVRAQGPAEQAGLRPDDVIKSINKQVIGNLDGLAKVLKGKNPGDQVEVAVDRSGQRETLLVTLAKKPSVPAPPAELESDAAPVPPSLPPSATPAAPADALPGTATPLTPASTAKPSLGITVKDLSDEARATYGLTVRTGALVTAVRPKSSADLAGVSAGAAIVAFDGQPIKESQDLVEAVRSSVTGQEVELSFYVGQQLRQAKITLAGAESTLVPPDKLQPAAPVPDQTPADSRPADKRPVLDRGEQPVEGLGRPGESVLPRTTSDDSGNPLELQRLVEALRSQMEALQKRLDEQEQRLQALEQPKP